MAQSCLWPIWTIFGLLLLAIFCPHHLHASRSFYLPRHRAQNLTATKTLDESWEQRRQNHLSSSSSSSDDDDDNFDDDVEDRLLFVQVVWRHGDRAPISTYPSDPNGEDKWPFGWGELTTLGIRQQMALGRLLRRRYILDKQPPFIGEFYSPKEIYIRSTDVNRTLASAMANLAGMYPTGLEEQPESNDAWPAHWVPIPVHTVPEQTDYIGNMLAKCPRADQLQERIQASAVYRNVTRSNAAFFDQLTRHAGRTFDLTNIVELSDTIYIETLYNLTQPNWITPSVIQRIQQLSLRSNEFFFGIQRDIYSPELIRLRGGNILRDIVDRMQLKLACMANPGARKNWTTNNDDDDHCSWIRRLKYYAYSAHDTTLAALLCTLGDEEQVVPGGLPHYTASIAVELWQTSAGPAVKILYHSAFHQPYHPITDLTSGCPKGQNLCPLATFRARSLKFMPANIQKECRKQQRDKMDDDPQHYHG